MKLKTDYVFPPILDRSHDWMAYDEDTYDGAEDSHPIVGWGATEEAAKSDFMEQWMEHEAERDMKQAVRQVKVWDSIFDRIFGKQS